MSPSAAADLERILYLARALQDSPERSEIEQRAVAALERVALLEQIARLARERESSTDGVVPTLERRCSRHYLTPLSQIAAPLSTDGVVPTLERASRLRAALAELAQE